MGEKDFDINRLRLDFIIEEIEIGEDDKGNKIIGLRLKLNPEHWEYLEENDAYYNKKLNIMIPVEELKKAIPTLNGKPVYFENILSENDEDYIKKLKEEYEKE